MDKKLSYRDLLKKAEFLKGLTVKKDKEIKKLRGDNHNLIHKLLRLFAAKHPDICEYFTDCDLHNGACVNKDSELRMGCKMYKNFETNNKKIVNN